MGGAVSLEHIKTIDKQIYEYVKAHNLMLTKKDLKMFQYISANKANSLRKYINDNYKDKYFATSHIHSNDIITEGILFAHEINHLHIVYDLLNTITIINAKLYKFLMTALSNKKIGYINMLNITEKNISFVFKYIDIDMFDDYYNINKNIIVWDNCIKFIIFHKRLDILEYLFNVRAINLFSNLPLYQGYCCLDDNVEMLNYLINKTNVISDYAYIIACLNGSRKCMNRFDIINETIIDFAYTLVCNIKYCKLEGMNKIGIVKELKSMNAKYNEECVKTSYVNKYIKTVNDIMNFDI
jgi:hypothetical protein